MSDIVDYIKNMSDEDLDLIKKYYNYEKGNEFLDELNLAISEYIKFIKEHKEKDSDNPLIINIGTGIMLNIFKTCIKHKDLLDVKIEDE